MPEQTPRDQLAELIAGHSFYVDDHKRAWCLGCLDETGKELLRLPTVKEYAEHLVPLIEGAGWRPAARTIDPEAIADEFGIQGLTVEGGLPTLATVPTTQEARDLVLAMSLALGKMLDDDQATNYVETEIKKAGRPAYVLNVRRAMGKTPHALRREAEARLDELRTQLQEKLALHRGSSTRCFDGEYKNPARKGYDIALTEVLGLLGVDATERRR